MLGSRSWLNRTRQAASLLRHPLLDIYALEGETISGYMRVLVADDGFTLSYIRDMIFPDGSSLTQKRHVSALRGPSLSSARADLVVVGANILLSELYARRGFWLVPKWVQLFLPIDEEPLQRLYDRGRQTRKYFKWMIKKVEDAGFECEIVDNPSWLDTFYNDMYLPYAARRFDESAVIHCQREVKQLFQRGGAVVVRRNGTPLAATVISERGSDLCLHNVGVINGDIEPVRDGAVFAMDYYIVQYAHKRGFKRVDFGHSRPFLSDGPLKYKMNWHMNAEDDEDGTGLFAIATPGQGERAMEFIRANPFFYITPEGLRSSRDITV